MASGKKAEKALTPEEKLAQALVPAEEQPYPVPENWCWCKLAELYQVNPKNVAPDDIDAAFIPMEKIAAGMVSEFSFEVQQWKAAKKGHTQFANGDVAFAKISPCFENRKSMVLDGLPNGIGGGTTELIVLRQPYVLPRYTFWLVSDENFIQGGKRTYSGTVGQQRISMDYVKNYPVPLPPIPEQQRIVDRIENLFAKLDEAKEKAQAVVDSFETRKAAILHRAFTGELTANWRKKHSVELRSWSKKSLQEVCSMKITDGTHKTPTYCDAENGVPFLSAKDVTSGEICWDNIKYIVPELHEELYARLAPQLDDILLAKNGTTGVGAIVDTEAVFDLYVTLAVLRPNTGIILPRYLLRIVNSPLCKNQFDEHLTGIGVPNLHLRDIKNVQITVPSIEEQAEIVRILDSLLDKEQQAKETAEAVIGRIDTMKKAILARAFRGELGTNDPAEESAVKLVKSIL